MGRFLKNHESLQGCYLCTFSPNDHGWPAIFKAIHERKESLYCNLRSCIGWPSFEDAEIAITTDDEDDWQVSPGDDLYTVCTKHLYLYVHGDGKWTRELKEEWGRVDDIDV